MSTASNHNGTAPNGARPPSPPPTRARAGGVQKGGPFDLAEMERLANEMFRAMPGAFLPGLDQEQLDPVRLDAERTALRPPPVTPPAVNGQMTEAQAALGDLAAELDLPSTGPHDAGGEATPERWSYVLDVPRSAAAAAPTSLPPSAASGFVELSGDPIPLARLGLAGEPRGAIEDPFADTSYFLREARPLGLAAGPVIPGAPKATAAPGAHPGLDVDVVRGQFPALAETVHGHRLVWLDNGATTHKPQAVIDRLSEFYRHENSNIHRGAHELAARATDAYERARDTAARFLHASGSDEIVFVRGTTEAINLVAQSWGANNVGPGDEILITWLEHHANIVPWQQLCQETGARLCVAPVDDRGQVMLDEFERLLSDRTRIVAFSHVSNVLGTVTPAREMTELAHRYGARVLIDGAQAVSHMPVDVQLLDSDWYAFSGHKVFGPTGIGVLHGKRDLLNAMPPWQGGGNMIRDVTFEHTEYQTAPERFEAGTASIADAVGLGAALEYVERLGRENIARHEHELLRYATAALHTVPGLELIGTAPDKAAVLSFVLPGLTPEEIGAELDRDGIAVRAGHHCAQPIVRRFGHEGTVRASMAVYNTCADVDALIAALRRVATRSADLPSRAHP
ncbi:MAG TPA: SufS family cysteine desulfurase [Solirubrobacteraceae bacterium]|nr:SufS family cysteine desulfurase [Solirubrobacteraceae bacterium]